MKRILSLVLSIVLVFSICQAVFADEPIRTQESIRVWNANTEISVELTGVSGDAVSVVVLKPGTERPTLSTDFTEFDKGVQHIDSAYLNEDGKLTFNYTAEDAGVYGIYVKGASIAYTATDNAAPVTNPDRIYVESWTGGGTYTHPDLSYMVTLSESQLDQYGAEAIAQSIWEQLESQPEGRRTIFINRDLSPYTNTTDRENNRIWWDTGVEAVSGKLDAFFSALSKISGATVDFLYADMEHTHSMYETTAVVQAVASHSRYPEFRAELEKRGYDFTVDGNTPFSSITTATDKYKDPVKKKNLQVYNAACAQLSHEYYTAAIYAPAAKYFGNVKYAEYGGDAAKVWTGKYDLAPRETYVGGNIKLAGTHAAPPLYSKRTKMFEYDFVYGVPGESGSDIKNIEIYSGAGADFKELQGNIGLYRIAESATKDGSVTPWVATESVGKDSFADARYRAEMIMHVALHNPDRILHYNPGTDETTTAEEQSEILMTVLDEVNDLVAYEDRRSLNIDQVDLSIPFAISGIYANGRNLWRITPDTEAETKSDLEITDKVFSSPAVTVTFPQGTIINVADTNSDIGYWIETAEGVNPIIEYSDQGDAEEAVISFYDVEYGQKADLATDTVVDAVASFKGYYGNNGLNFIAAKYDANGVLIDIETKRCGILSSYGNAAFVEIGKDLDTDKIKFYLWENETIRPLAAEEM